MKKLMTMIGAAAMAFGLFATDPVAFLGGTAFEANETGTSFVGGVLSTDWWTIPDGTPTCKAIEGDSNLPKTEKGRPKYFWNTLGSTTLQVLDVKTTLGSPISHNIKSGGGKYTVESGVYFDGLVNFTLFDYGDTVQIPDGAKIAVYPQLQAEADTVAKLVIKAADEDGAKEFVTAKTIEDNSWHRITIKTIANVYATGDACVGFVVFLDGNMVSATSALEITEANLTSNAKNFNKDGGLFLSRGDGNLTFNNVAFDGTGKLDEIMFTEVAPFDDAADTKYFTVNGLANVSAFNYALDAGEATPATIINGVAELELGKGTVTTIHLTGITYAEGWCGPATEDITVGDTKSFTFTDAAVAAASFNGVGYERVQDAIDAIEAEGVLKIFPAGADADMEIPVEGYAVTVDLNGQTVGGLEGVDNIILTNSNASADAIVSGKGVSANPLQIASANIKIIYEGNEKLEATLIGDIADQELAPVGQYWVVQPITVTEVPVPAAEAYPYDATEKVPYAETDKYTVTGQTTGTDAGNYTVTFALKDTVHNKWKGKDTTENQQVTWTIAQAEVAVPTADPTEFTYDGNAQTVYTVPDGAKFKEAAGSVSTATDAGNYTAKFELLDEKNYKWATTYADIDWSIKAKAVTVTVELDKTEANVGDQAPVVTVKFDDVAHTETGDFDITWNPTLDMNTAGEYTCTATAKGNYSGTSEGVKFTVKTAAAPVPGNMNGASKDQKDAYTAWVAGLKEQGITIDTSDDATAIAFALEMTDEDLKGYDTVEKAVEAKLAAKITPEMVAAIAAGGLDNGKLDEATFKTLEGDYVNAEFTFVQATELESTDTAKFYHLSAGFKPANAPVE